MGIHEGVLVDHRWRKQQQPVCRRVEPGHGTWAWNLTDTCVFVCVSSPAALWVWAS